jgi:hypothetical protein
MLDSVRPFSGAIARIHSRTQDQSLASGPGAGRVPRTPPAIERFLASPEAAFPSRSASDDKLRLARSNLLRLQLRHWCGLAIGRKKHGPARLVPLGGFRFVAEV